MKDCECVYRIYIGKNKEKAQERLIEKYEEFVALGAKEITVKVDETIMEGGNRTTYPYRPFEKTMNYIIRPLGKYNNDDNDDDDNNSDEEDEPNKQYEESKGAENEKGNEKEDDEGKENEEGKEKKTDKEKEVENLQDIRDFYSKLSNGVVCICVV
jgi:hypothetical protein